MVYSYQNKIPDELKKKVSELKVTWGTFTDQSRKTKMTSTEVSWKKSNLEKIQHGINIEEITAKDFPKPKTWVLQLKRSKGFVFKTYLKNSEY